MPIILTAQPNISSNDTLNILGDFGQAIGVPGFDPPASNRGYKTSFQAVQEDLNGVLNKLLGKKDKENVESSYVGSGKQITPEGLITNGAPLENASIKQVYSQSPNISVIIKKKAFSGLRHLYDPSLMDPAEKWLMRAIKRLVRAKCEAMALYERLTKIQRLEESGASPGLIMASLVTTLAEERGINNTFTSAMNLQRAQADRQPPEITTYYTDYNLPWVEELGPGNGIFEITAITDVNTNLDLNGNGNCSFNIEDPYRILIVNEGDIENAIRETALSGFVDVISATAGVALTVAQTNDSMLEKERSSRNASSISFSIGIGSESSVSAVIDAIGFEINADNLDQVPEAHALTSSEQILFLNTLNNLENYQNSMKKRLLSGLGNINSIQLKEEIRYVRDKLRLYHMGKAIIQPMDTVHVYLDSGTRKLGETGNVENINEKFDITSVTGSLNVAGHILGLQNEVHIDDELLRIEWEREGQHMSFRDFKTLRTLQGSGEGGAHVFGGLVNRVGDQYDANSGRFTLSVSCGTNMDWLKISRFNTSPSLTQLDGVIYDPLTPFKIKIDEATGLPTGKPELLDINQKILNGELDSPKIYFSTGERVGTQAKNLNDMEQDIQRVGGNIISLYQHAPGLVYRWKSGIITATYNLSSTDPKDGTSVSYKQLRREVGFYASNTPFDGMDAANIISLMTTGFPYDPVRFMQSAINTGTFSIDSTYNDFRHFFHTFLDVQRSLNLVQGGFVPFKTLTINPQTLAKNLEFQRKLKDKSSRLQQVRTQRATLEDKLSLLSSAKDVRTSKALTAQLEKLNNQEQELINEIEGLEEVGEFQKNSVLYVAGNDVTFELSDEGSKLFGDRLKHATLRRREDVVRGNDANYLIISDQYDKDYDIQAFLLRLKQQATEMWKGKWEDPYTICKKVAEALDFEFFVDTQGHLNFRPPQYNKTPATVLNGLFSMDQSSGITVFPDFLKKLFLGREETIINEINTLEWEIILNGALLGYTNKTEVERFISDSSGNDELFIHDRSSYIREIVKKNSPKAPQEKERFLEIVKQSNQSAQLNGEIAGGVFNAVSQARLQQRTLKSLREENINENGSKVLYNTARKRLVALRGGKLSSIEEFDKKKIGAVRNGNKTPASDIARIISNISDLVNRRSKLLLLLEKILQQNIQITNLDEGGEFKFSPQGLINTNYKQAGELYDQFIEDDTKNILGHMSGERFIIKDEHIVSSSFSETPPAITAVSVNGTEPIVGEGGGNLASIPVYSAFGADFDLWRQYGWRSENTYEKPFFWSAEQQCAPYAYMLLSRQRKNIVTGTVRVLGNEYYQLGDIVYITHRNMLYYVDSIRHSFSYGGNCYTELGLKYGHTPGEYIPTPLDVIGKGLITRGQTQLAYRMRRTIPQEDTVLGVIEFGKNNIELFGGPQGERNLRELKRAASTALTDINLNDPTISSRIYVISYGGLEEVQDARARNVETWFHCPFSPTEPQNGIGPNGLGNTENLLNTSPQSDMNIGNYQIGADYTRRTHIKQTQEYETLSASEKELLRSGLVASQKTMGIDPTLKNVIEIRLRQPPSGGWEKTDGSTG